MSALRLCVSQLMDIVYKQLYEIFEGREDFDG